MPLFELPMGLDTQRRCTDGDQLPDRSGSQRFSGTSRPTKADGNFLINGTSATEQKTIFKRHLTLTFENLKCGKKQSPTSVLNYIIKSWLARFGKASYSTDAASYLIYTMKNTCFQCNLYQLCLKKIIRKTGN